MAGEEGQERTEEATPKRQQDARTQGQIPRSRELTNLLLLGSAALMMSLYGSVLGQELLDVFRESFTLGKQQYLDEKYLFIHFSNCVSHITVGTLPFLIVLLIGAVLGNVMLGGLNFSAEAMAFKFDRLDPIAGIQKLFSIKSLVELGKAILKIFLMFGTFYMFIGDKISLIFTMDQLSLKQSIAKLLELLSLTTLVMLTPLVVIAAVDAPFQIWNHNRQLRMSKQEIRDESKDTEGKPEVKSKLRRMQMEMRKRRMMADVPSADVVITNPNHFAVALSYKEEFMATPVVVAKGADYIAELIKKVANANDVPIVSAPPLARSLYYNVEIEEEIPSGLFVAVAKILAYVYELRLHKKGKLVKPKVPLDFEIPEELQR